MRASLIVLFAPLASGEADWRAGLQRAVNLHGAGDLHGASGEYRSALDAHPPLRENWAILTNYALAIQPEAPAEAAAAFEVTLRQELDLHLCESLW